MAGNIKPFLALSALLFTIIACKWYDQAAPVVSPNGLSCQNYTNYGSSGEGAECSYICPDQTVRQPALPERFTTSSPLYTASKEELDMEFCDMASTPVSTDPPPSAASTATPPASPTAQPSPTVELRPTLPPPLLTGEVTSCDRAMNLINFRMAEVAPDLEGKSLEVLISNEPGACAVNSLNPSLLTCRTSSSLVFPMRVVVRLDGAVVNDFTSDGFGCLVDN